MRLPIIAIAAAALLLPAAPALACGAKASAQASASELSAAAKKAVKKVAKKKKKAKVEYMRAVPVK